MQLKLALALLSLLSGIFRLPEMCKFLPKLNYKQEHLLLPESKLLNVENGKVLQILSPQKVPRARNEQQR